MTIEYQMIVIENRNQRINGRNLNPASTIQFQIQTSLNLITFQLCFDGLIRHYTYKQAGCLQ